MDRDNQPHRIHWRGNDEMAERRAKAEAEAKAESTRSARNTWLMAGLLLSGLLLAAFLG